MEDPWADVEASGKWLLDLERDYAPEVVHLNSFGHGALPWRKPVLLTAHSCVLSWWAAVKREPAPASWDRYRAAVTQSLAAADLVTAPSSSMARALAQHYGVGACRVIANGRDAARFHQREKKPFIFVAGRVWDEAKNISAVAHVAADLAWPVYVAGDPGQAQFPVCYLLGSIAPAELACWYARAAIYALPARYEPFGLSILEAAYSGCALVVGDIPSLREIWRDAALFVAPDDTEALRAAFETLIGNAELREEMARRARVRALSYNVPGMARRYLHAYQKAATARETECVS
jgi:glycosyltransferase involved in cell wall biosynthesis